MSGSALEGGAIFEGEGQAAIRVGRIKDDHKIENCTTSLIRVAAA